MANHIIPDPYNVSIQDTDENDVIIEGQSTHRLTTSISFSLPGFITTLCGEDDTDYSVHEHSLHVTLLLFFTFIFVFIMYINIGLSPDREDLLSTLVILMVSFFQIICVFCVVWLVCSNRRQSSNLKISTETPTGVEIHPCFLNFVWDNQHGKYGIKVIFMWIFGFGSLLSSAISIRVLAYCVEVGSSVKAVTIADITYHICFIIFVFSLLTFVNYFFNFRFTNLTTRIQTALTILVAGMISIWMYLLLKFNSSTDINGGSSLNPNNSSTDCNHHVHQTFTWIQSVQDLLHPALIGFSFFGIYMISKLFHSFTDPDINGDRHQLRTAEDDNREVNGAATPGTRTPQPSQISKEGNCLTWFFGILWFSAMIMFSVLVFLSQGGRFYESVLWFKLLFRVNMIILYFPLSVKLKRHCHLKVTTTSYGAGRCFFLMCFVAVVFFHGLLFLEGLFALISSYNFLELTDVESIIDIALSILWIYLQTIFIMKADVYSRNGTYDTCWPIENISTFLGIINFGEWIFFAINSLPMVKLYLVKEDVYRIPDVGCIQYLVYPFVYLYFLISWMELRYISRRFQDEYSKHFCR